MNARQYEGLSPGDGGIGSFLDKGYSDRFFNVRVEEDGSFEEPSIASELEGYVEEMENQTGRVRAVKVLPEWVTKVDIGGLTFDEERERDFNIKGL
ncbi:MAG: hypothetical protein ABEJ03_02110 [Candidatus Nanohaloarchaea archaeon]